MHLKHCLYVIAAAVAYAAVPAAQQTAPPKAAPSASHTPHWGYATGPDVVGPSQWGSLSGNTACSAGHEQSPIDLPAGSTAAMPLKAGGPQFTYHPAKLVILDNGHTIQMNTDPGNAINVAGKTYKLAQFHFHAPSEHTIGGKHFPLEIHLVHVDDANRPAAVVGILVKAGESNAALDAAFKHLPQHEGEQADLASPLDLPALPPSTGGFWHYSGSLTTPPCTESVQWFVMDTAISMSQAQIASFTTIPHMDGTARPVQPLGDRKLERLARQ